MRLITSHRGELQTLISQQLAPEKRRSFSTGLPAWDALAPQGRFACGAIHELLGEQICPQFLAGLLARSARMARNGALVWCDSSGDLFPPALRRIGIDLARLLVLRPGSDADAVWAVTECLRCKGVAAVVAAFEHLSRIQARRLQLAAETGGGVGIFLRPAGKASGDYAAATRWKVSPAGGQRTIQRWRMELIQGHGGQVGKVVVLESCRETDHLHISEPMAHRPNQEKSRRLA